MQDKVLDAEPLVSVIIVTWNALPLLQQFLPSVVASSYANIEIILADNASTDGSAEWVSNTYPSIRVVRHDENYGFSRGNNLAIAEASGEFVTLLNNDVEVDPHWLEPMVQQMVSDPRIAAVQPKILKWNARDRFEYAGAAGGFIDRWGFPFARGRMFDTLEIDGGQYDTVEDILWATGAAAMFRRTHLDEVGLLDERFFMHQEEIDLCWRLRRRGYRIVCEPRSVVYHLGGGSLAESSDAKTYYNFRNNLLTLYKNLPPADWRRVRLGRTVLDGIAALRAVLLGRPGEAKAIWRGHRDARRLRREYPGSPAGASLPASVYRGSVVLDYYIRRRRRFSDLPADRFGSD